MCPDHYAYKVPGTLDEIMDDRNGARHAACTRSGRAACCGVIPAARRSRIGPVVGEGAVVPALLRARFGVRTRSCAWARLAGAARKRTMCGPTGGGDRYCGVIAEQQ